MITLAQIEQLAERSGVRQIAVENFLGTLGQAGSAAGERRNLSSDALAYGWNAATVRAIERGIDIYYGTGRPGSR
jgi:hypothetical protein